MGEVTTDRWRSRKGSTGPLVYAINAAVCHFPIPPGRGLGVYPRPSTPDTRPQRYKLELADSDVWLYKMNCGCLPCCQSRSRKRRERNRAGSAQWLGACHVGDTIDQS